MTAFNFERGKLVAGKYQILEKLGQGYEGEVYRAIENYTKRLVAIKLYYPNKNYAYRSSIKNSQKLNMLADCPIVVGYYGHEVINFRKEKIAVIVCEYIEGEILDSFVTKQKGKRLSIFPALHLLYSLVKGLEYIHSNGEYHGDLHTENIIIKRFGLEFDLKIIDFHHWGDSKKDNREEDIVKTIRIFYDILGGAKHYKKLPPSIKYIICGLKRGLILDRFKTMSHLKTHLELMDWSDAV